MDSSIENVEFKLTVGDGQEGLVRARLRDAKVEPQRRRVFFFDTAKLELFDAGVLLRARVTRDDADDSTVKLRPIDPSAIGPRWRRTKGFRIELDVVGDTPVCSAKLEAEQARGEIDKVATDKRPLRKLFSKDQERLTREYAPIGISWDELAVLGPVEVRKFELRPAGFPHKLTVEEWVLPDQSDLVELSIKVPPDEAADAENAFRALLADFGIVPDGDQRAKARTVLEFFAARLRAPERPARTVGWATPRPVPRMQTD